MFRAHAATAATLALLAFAVAGCFNPFSPLVRGVGQSKPPPVADSPSGVLRRFEWAYRNRSIEVYKELFTADYRFVFSALDTNGNAYRERPFTRDDDIESTTNLFQGGHASEPAATEIRLDLDRNFNVFADPRPVPPYRDPGWHKNIRTTVSLNITTTDGDVTTVQGFANFFLVHEDSANVPVELRDRVYGDATVSWFIERWEDETFQSGSGAQAAPLRAALEAARTGAAPAAATAERPRTWGFIKRVFHRLPS